MAEPIDDIMADFDEKLEDAAEQVAGKEQEQEQEEHRGNRAQERIRQLIQERNSDREELEELRRRVTAAEELKEQVRQLRERQQQADAAAEQKPPAPEPSFMEDPEGHIQAKVGKLEAHIAKLEKAAEAGGKESSERLQQAQQQLAMMQFQQRIQADEAAVMKEHPDYYDALAHSRQVRMQEMQFLGMKEKEIVEAINREELNAAAAALRMGRNPAAFAYQRAVLSGYKAGAAPAAKGDEMTDEERMLAGRLKAGSIGETNAAGDASIATPEEQAWDPIERAFKELFGEDLK